MTVEFDATLGDFVDVTIRSLERSQRLRTWEWRGIASVALFAAFPAFALVSGSIAIRLTIGLAAAGIAVVLYLWISPRTYRSQGFASRQGTPGGEAPLSGSSIAARATIGFL
jgi:hypothetical protein